MAIAEPDWYSEDFRRLLLADIASQLPGTSTTEIAAFPQEDAWRLLRFASALALSDDTRQLKESYEIVSRLIELFGDELPAMVAAADLIFSRLGNFPGRTLLRNRYRPNGINAPALPQSLFLERLAREAENTIEEGGVSRTLTDFQHRLLRTLAQFPSVSVSAPTSAGKSFVMGLDLLRRLSGSTPSCVVYVVPTRALIREVSLEVRRKLKESRFENVPVRTVPFPLSPAKATKGAVFVLTQERLMSFLHAREGERWITTLVVDEAQGVRDEARGVILQTAVEAVLIRFPKIEIHFASPLARNPDFLLQLIQRENVGSAFIEEISPVSQNLILVSPVFRKPSLIDVEAIFDGETVHVGRRTMPVKLNTGVYSSRAAFAWTVTGEDECTVVYADAADDAEELAKAMVANRPSPHDVPAEIRELIEYVRTEVHEDYPLIDCLPHGVAFHYGPMPAIVRSRVEDLCKARLIKIVCCTSTLLQGVNLPTRHIIIENPKRGIGKPMKRRDFLNLAGRAGRLLKEFHGNVWCFRPAAWEEKSFAGEPLQEIESAVDVAMADGGTIVQKVLNEEAKGRELDYGEATLGKLYADYIRANRTIAESTWKTDQNASTLAQTELMLKALDISLPDEILNENRSVRPDRLQNLFNFLKEIPDPRAWMPLRPGLPESNDRMGQIIQLLLERLGGEANQRHIYLKQLAIKWIYNMPLSAIISQHIAYNELRGETTPRSTLIRRLLTDLETDIRFRLVKYYLAFGSVLELALRERGFKHEAEQIEPFHVYLECGASDRVALNLIALGLSRSTALALRSIISFPHEATPEDCLATLSTIDIATLKIPSLSRREVADLL
jgi:hypothetical protein